MPKIYWKNFDKTTEIQDGGTILDNALENDIPLEHVCGGYCSCTTCHVHIVEGLENTSKTEEDELDRLEVVDQKQTTSRLGCQTKVHGDIVVNVISI